ncbi:cell wall anchored protein [Fusarium oxysporum f. sp. phaseoli]
MSLLLLWCFLGLSTAQNDPIKDFCRRWGHQTAVVDRKLYIDGGLINFQPSAENASCSADTNLTYNDLSSVSEYGVPPFYTNLSKSNSIPSVHGGILWEDSVNKRLYLYGGEYYRKPPPPFKLYSYDILYNTWKSLGRPTEQIKAASYGAGVSIPERGEAYYYGGWLSNASVEGWKGPPRASNGLIIYDMDINGFQNLEGPDRIGRAEGVMVYIPIGDLGVLVYFGGSKDLYGNGTLTPQPLNEIFLFDIANQIWYTQKTSGSTPQIRRRFCGGVTWDKDRSSYNIYIYGGAGFPPDTIGYDDLYILTLPTFQWIRGPYLSYNNGTGTYPKSMMSCNVVDNAQMLVIGGTYSNATEDTCDVPTIQGVHNMNLGKQNQENVIWAEYDPDLTTYVVPTDILKAVVDYDGSGTTKTAPVSGFDTLDVAVIMKRTARSGSRAATRPTDSTATATRPADNNTPASKPPSHSSIRSPSLSAGGIAGIAVGCSMVLVLALVGCFFLTYRRKKYYSHNQEATGPPVPAELASETRLPYRHWRISLIGSKFRSGSSRDAPVELACETEQDYGRQSIAPISGRIESGSGDAPVELACEREPKHGRESIDLTSSRIKTGSEAAAGDD